MSTISAASLIALAACGSAVHAKGAAADVPAFAQVGDTFARDGTIPPAMRLVRGDNEVVYFERDCEGRGNLFRKSDFGEYACSITTQNSKTSMKIDPRCMPRMYTPSYGTPRRGAILLLGDYTGCNDQLIATGSELAAQGYYVYVPTNPGAGTVENFVHVDQQATSGEYSAWLKDIVGIFEGQAAGLGLQGIPVGKAKRGQEQEYEDPIISVIDTSTSRRGVAAEAASHSQSITALGSAQELLGKRKTGKITSGAATATASATLLALGSCIAGVFSV